MGDVLCWGANDFGLLGDGTTTDRWTPTPVTGLDSGVAAITVGMNHTCALKADGGVVCWGYNISGQLGDGTTTTRLTPVAVSGLEKRRGSDHGGRDPNVCADNGRGRDVLGGNDVGQLGDGTTTTRLTPVAVSGLESGVAAITVGGTQTCALTTGGGVMCWGGNDVGQLGDGTTTTRLTPVAVSGLGSGVAAITTGSSHSCAVTVNGGVVCWGSNTSSQLGDGSDHEPIGAGCGGWA